MAVTSMLQMIKKFYEGYPDNLLNVYGKRRSDIAPDLLERINKFREGQLHNLGQAETFKVDDDAEAMLAGLMNEMTAEGLEDTYQHVKLPFPVILIERTSSFDGFKRLGLLMQFETTIEAQFFRINSSGVIPSLTITSTCDYPLKSFMTPTAMLANTISGIEKLSESMIQDQVGATSFLAMGVGIATLLRYKGMLEVEEKPAHPRAERRRAEKAGQPLPDIRISRISLGKAGKGQLAAMNRDRKNSEASEVKRRAHWVRGHWMRTAAGGLSFRMPHIRGAGPLIHQERYVTE